MTEMSTKYNPTEVENNRYNWWLEKEVFKADNKSKKNPYTIVIPPPNVTGKLHIGHAWDTTLQDMLTRYKRLKGFDVLYLPGMDHAGISTQAKVEAKMREEGLSRYDLGREKFLERAWEWKEEYAGYIRAQWAKLGLGLDYSRERFTLDEGLNKAVTKIFVDHYNNGTIYRGEKIINWDPVQRTALSNIEVIHKDVEGAFYHLKYFLADGSGDYLEVATTRPETLFGDTAVAVHPEDERYQKYIGKTVLLPVTNKEIPVIADEYVEKDFGSGVVKITPAHDPNDFEVGKRHNLEEINILYDDGKINLPGSKYHNMDRYEARKAVVEDLKSQGLLVKTVAHKHSVGTHDRCKTIVEPMIKPQWFVKMEEMAKPAIESVKNGSLKFVPESFSKIYLHWLENIRDWCISRQLWWGHRIPAYYCSECKHMEVGSKEPTYCPVCAKEKDFIQDEDTLDTWFSSALWPFSTLGWPRDTKELSYFYPTDVLVTGYDIIFFWVVRMVFSALEQTGKEPFNTVLIHGLVRDSQGRKMSKSLGNGIDPLEVIDKYGADALRMTLMTGNAPGNDMRFYFEKVEASRNFANKIWNASRFIMMNVKDDKEPVLDKSKLKIEDKWILSKSNNIVKEVTENLDKYELGIALSKIYDFLWEEFCDWYIEMLKPRLWNEADESRETALWVLKKVLIDMLKLLHPFMPFITEEIFLNLSDEESIMISKWPVYDEALDMKADEDKVESIKAAVRAIRNIRTSMNVVPSKKLGVHLISKEAEVRDVFEESRVIFMSLAGANELYIEADKAKVPDDAVSAVIAGADIYIPFEDLVDVEKEKERLKKEEVKLLAELDRVNNMLGNEKFISKAPASKIEEEKEKLDKYTKMLEQLREQLVALEKR